MLIVFSIISLCVSIPTNAFKSEGDIDSPAKFRKVVEDWFERTTLNNKELSSNFKGWVHVALVLIFSLLTIRTV